MAGSKRYRNSVKIRLGTWNIGTLNGNGVEMCDEQWKRNTELCFLQQVRWRGRGAGLIGVEGRRYKLWWLGRNQDGYGGVGALVKEEPYD